MKIILMIRWTVVTCIFTSCISYKPVTIDEIKSIGFKDNNMTSGKVQAVLKVNNPNNYSIKVKKYDLTAYINEQNMGKVLVDENIVIPKKTNQDYTLTFSPDLSKILGIIPVFLSKGSADAAIKGKVKVKALIFSKSFDVNLQKKVNASDF